MCPVSDALQVISDLRSKLICVEEVFGERFHPIEIKVKQSRCKKKAYLRIDIGNGYLINPLFGTTQKGVSPEWVKKKLFPILDDLASTLN